MLTVSANYVYLGRVGRTEEKTGSQPGCSYAEHLVTGLLQRSVGFVKGRCKARLKCCVSKESSQHQGSEVRKRT